MISSLVCTEYFTIIRTRLFLRLGIIIQKFGRLVGMLSLRNKAVPNTKVLIEAGSLGWEAVFYEELRDSLIDYLSVEMVACSCIDRSRNYLRQSIRMLRKEKPTHYCFDPRTGPQTRFRSLMNTSIVMFCLGFWNITPIVVLSDASIRLWRYQAFLLTGSSGLVVTFLDPQSMGPLFPHERVIGPSFMPISLKRLDSLDHLEGAISQKSFNFAHIFFLGSLYSQRVAFLHNLNSELQVRQSKVQLIVEEKSPNISSDNYWNKIASYPCLITTTFQNNPSNYSTDRIYIDQMVFRISETLAAGKLLFSSDVPGMHKYFVENYHFVSYASISDATDKIIYFSEHPAEAIKIALEGRMRYRELVEKSTFWIEIDKLLIKKLRATPRNTI
jgi:hypothetical protein